MITSEQESVSRSRKLLLVDGRYLPDLFFILGQMWPIHLLVWNPVHGPVAEPLVNPTPFYSGMAPFGCPHCMFTANGRSSRQAISRAEFLARVFIS